MAPHDDPAFDHAASLQVQRERHRQIGGRKDSHCNLWILFQEKCRRRRQHMNVERWFAFLQLLHTSLRIVKNIYTPKAILRSGGHRWPQMQRYSPPACMLEALTIRYTESTSSSLRLAQLLGPCMATRDAAAIDALVGCERFMPPRLLMCWDSNSGAKDGLARISFQSSIVPNDRQERKSCIGRWLGAIAGNAMRPMQALSRAAEHALEHSTARRSRQLRLSPPPQD